MAPGGEPPAPARMDHCGPGAGAGQLPAGALSAQRGDREPGLHRTRRGRVLEPASVAGHAAVRAVGAGPGRGLVGQPRTGGQRRHAGRRAPQLPRNAGARHLALLRAGGRARGQPPAARQPAVRTRAHHRAPHLADQHRHVPAGQLLRTRVRLARHHGARRPAAGDLRHHRPHGQAPGPSLQLVRHALARAAAAVLRVQRRQRQPCRPPAGRGPGLPQLRGRRQRRRRATRSPRPALRGLVRGHGFPRALRRQAPPVPHRPQGRGERARCELLRPARLRSAAAELPRHRQGRRAATPLDGARAAFSLGRRTARAQVLVGLDVRVPDAHAGDGRAGGRPAAGGQPRGGQRAAGLRQHAEPAMGRLGVGLLRAGPFARLPVLALRRAAAGAAPHAAHRPRGRALRHHDGRRARAGRCGGQPAAARIARWARRVRLLRRDRLHRLTPARGPAFHRGAQRHGPPPRHGAGGTVQRRVRRRAAPLVRQRAAGAGARVAAARAHAAADHRQRRSAHAARAEHRRGAADLPAARGRSSRARLPAHPPAVERPLHRGAARQRRGREPLAFVQREPLARRSAARRLRHVLLCAGHRQPDAHLADRPARARRRVALPRALPGRPGAVRCQRARPAGAHHGADQPRRRHGAAHGRAAQHRQRDAHAGARLVLRTGALRPQGRRGAPVLRQPLRREPLGARLARAAADAQAAPARRPGGGRCALRGLGRCAGAVGRLHDRPARLHRAQPHARDADPRSAIGSARRYAGQRAGSHRLPARAPRDPAGRYGTRNLRHRGRRGRGSPDAQHRPLPAADARRARDAHGRHAGAGAPARPQHRPGEEPGAAGPRPS